MTNHYPNRQYKLEKKIGCRILGIQVHNVNCMLQRMSKKLFKQEIHRRLISFNQNRLADFLLVAMATD